MNWKLEKKRNNWQWVMGHSVKKVLLLFLSLSYTAGVEMKSNCCCWWTKGFKRKRKRKRGKKEKVKKFIKLTLLICQIHKSCQVRNVVKLKKQVKVNVRRDTTIASGWKDSSWLIHLDICIARTKKQSNMNIIACPWVTIKVLKFLNILLQVQRSQG